MTAETGLKSSSEAAFSLPRRLADRAGGLDGAESGFSLSGDITFKVEGMPFLVFDGWAAGSEMMSGDEGCETVINTIVNRQEKNLRDHQQQHSAAS